MTTGTPLNESAVLLFILNVLLQMSLLSVSALLIARTTCRHNPGVRYVLCMVTILGMLVLPLTVAITGRVGCRVLTWTLPVDLVRSATANRANVAHVLPSLRTAPSATPGLPEPISGLLAIWLCGVAIGVIRLADGYRKVSRLIRVTHPWEAPQHTEALDAMANVCGPRLPAIHTAPFLASPVAVGMRHPQIILPEGLTERLTPMQLKHVLLHEGAHIALHHTISGFAERLVRLLFWPHPLTYLVCRELDRAREEVCDNVASQADGAACYARTLLAIAQGMFDAPHYASALALLGPETSLETRIAGLLHPRRNRMVNTGQWKSWAVGVGVFVMASTLVVRVVKAQDHQDPMEKDPTTNALSAKKIAEDKAERGHRLEFRRGANNTVEIYRDNVKIGQVKYQPAGNKNNTEAQIIKQKEELTYILSADKTRLKVGPPANTKMTYSLVSLPNSPVILPDRPHELDRKLAPITAEFQAKLKAEAEAKAHQR